MNERRFRVTRMTYAGTMVISDFMPEAQAIADFAALEEESMYIHLIEQVRDDFHRHGAFWQVVKSKVDTMAQEFINFGDVVRDAGLGQCQYVSRYVGGLHEHPDLSQGLRFQGDPANYHSLQIAAADAAEFVERVQRYRRQAGI